VNAEWSRQNARRRAFRRAASARAVATRLDVVLPQVALDGLEQAVLGERLGQVFVGTHHPAARPIEQPVLRREHDHRRVPELLVLLDQCAGLVAVEPRHHDVDEDHLRLVVGDLRQGVEAVLGEDHLAARLEQEDLGAAGMVFESRSP